MHTGGAGLFLSADDVCLSTRHCRVVRCNGMSCFMAHVHFSVLIHFDDVTAIFIISQKKNLSSKRGNVCLSCTVTTFALKQFTSFLVYCGDCTGDHSPVPLQRTTVGVTTVIEKRPYLTAICRLLKTTVVGQRTPTDCTRVIPATILSRFFGVSSVQRCNYLQVLRL